LWFFKESTNDFFFADESANGPWRQFANTDGRIWWWHEELNTSFYESDCDSDGGHDQGESFHAHGEHKADGVWTDRQLDQAHSSRSHLALAGGEAVAGQPHHRMKEFQVVLDRDTLDDRFGIALRVDPCTMLFTVSEVKAGGLCARYNSDMQQFSEESSNRLMQVLPGDQVHTVNSLSGIEDIKNELMTAFSVRLRVTRQDAWSGEGMHPDDGMRPHQ
jgi:hypothetical protein